MSNKALLIIDLQNDFCKSGSLEVPNAEEIIPQINKLMNEFDLIIATKDWHPKNHKSFANNHSLKKVGDIITLNNSDQVLWPNHCIQNTKGANLHPDLKTSNINKIFYKGTNEQVDSYSGFFDNDHKNSTGLFDYLKTHNVQEVYITGLATDYCVKYTALDAKQLGFDVFVIQNACKGVELNKGDTKNALNTMEALGIKIL